jgi:hypothetical protein
MASFYARAVEHGAVHVAAENLALENTTVFERKVEHVPLRSVGHWIEPYDGRLIVDVLNHVAHTAEVAMTTVQTPDAPNRLTLRHLGHTTRTDARTAPACTIFPKMSAVSLSYMHTTVKRHRGTRGGSVDSVAYGLWVWFALRA